MSMQTLIYYKYYIILYKGTRILKSVYKEMKQSEIKPLKEKLWLANNKCCPVLNKPIVLEKMVLDHAHKALSDEYSPEKGVIREALDFRTNAVLGKLENSLKRTGLTNEPGFSIGDFLRNAADYFESGSYQDENGAYYVHPKEVHKEPKLKKMSYNKLKKVYNGKAKFPNYPKSQKLTKQLEKLYIKYSIVPEYYA